MNGRSKLVATTSAVVLGSMTASGATLLAIAAVMTTNEPDEVMPFVFAGIAGVIVMAVTSHLLNHANEWSDAFPVRSYLASTVRFIGLGIGAAVATAVIDRLAVRITAGIVAAGLVALAALSLVRLREEMRDTAAERDRIARLRDHGRRVRADVVEASSTGVWVSGLLLFEVVAEYETRSGLHQVYERLLTTLENAPTAGGTVLLWVTADGSDPTDVLMELDPSSIRHPDPDQFVTPPDPQRP